MKSINLMKSLVIVAAMALVDVAVPQEPTPTPATCSATPPALPTLVLFDPNPARYTLPQDPETHYVLDDKGATTTFQDVGQLYTHQCPNSTAFWFEEDQWVLHDAPICWKREPVRISSCP